MKRWAVLRANIAFSFWRTALGKHQRRTEGWQDRTKVSWGSKPQRVSLFSIRKFQRRLFPFKVNSRILGSPVSTSCPQFLPSIQSNCKLKCVVGVWPIWYCGSTHRVGGRRFSMRTLAMEGVDPIVHLVSHLYQEQKSRTSALRLSAKRINILINAQIPSTTNRTVGVARVSF